VEVPFTRIGPKQVVRLAYQVIGNGGPIPNPSNIRYLAPGSDEASSLGLAGPPSLPPLPADASAVMGAVQLANLGIAATNLAISSAVLVEVKQQTRMLREIQVGLSEVRAGVSDLLERTERIDLNVAEVQLRETLKHALRSAAKNDEVDLLLLAELVGRALDRFFQSIGGVIDPGTKRDLTLSSDVREMAEAALHLLWAARLTAIEAHNFSCFGDPLKVVRDDGVQTGLRRLSETAALVAATGVITDIADTVEKKLSNNRLFFGSTDGLRRGMQKQLAGLDTALDRLPSVPHARSLLLELKDQDLLDQTAALPAVLNDYLLAWTAHTDAGLLWRLRYELDLQSDETYWQGLEGWMTELTPGAAESPLGVTRGVSQLVS
jgi:hypothetical protein